MFTWDLVEIVEFVSESILKEEEKTDHDHAAWGDDGSVPKGPEPFSFHDLSDHIS